MKTPSLRARLAAFTLIEMAVVVAVTSLILGVAVPRLLKIREDATCARISGNIQLLNMTANRVRLAGATPPTTFCTDSDMINKIVTWYQSDGWLKKTSINLEGVTTNDCGQTWNGGCATTTGGGTPTPTPGASPSPVSGSVFAANNVTVAPSATDFVPMQFTVTLLQPLSTASEINVNTIDGSALGGTDYQPVINKLLQYPVGTTAQTVTVFIKPHPTPLSSDRSFTLDLTNPNPSNLASVSRTGTGTLLGANSGTPTPTPTGGGGTPTPTATPTGTPGPSPTPTSSVPPTYRAISVTIGDGVVRLDPVTGTKVVAFPVQLSELPPTGTHPAVSYYTSQPGPLVSPAPTTLASSSTDFGGIDPSTPDTITFEDGLTTSEIVIPVFNVAYTDPHYFQAILTEPTSVVTITEPHVGLGAIQAGSPPPTTPTPPGGPSVTPPPSPHPSVTPNPNPSSTPYPTSTPYPYPTPTVTPTPSPTPYIPPDPTPTPSATPWNGGGGGAGYGQVYYGDDGNTSCTEGPTGTLALPGFGGAPGVHPIDGNPWPVFAYLEESQSATHQWSDGMPDRWCQHWDSAYSYSDYSFDIDDFVYRYGDGSGRPVVDVTLAISHLWSTANGGTGSYSGDLSVGGSGRFDISGADYLGGAGDGPISECGFCCTFCMYSTKTQARWNSVTVSVEGSAIWYGQ